MIELKCPRCETMLRVPESKAGRHGRCPVCGGTITVPLPPVEIPPAPIVAPPKPPRSNAIWVVLVVIILLSAIGVAIALRRGGTLGTAEEGNGPTLTAAQQARLDAQLIEIGKLEEIVRKYRESRVRERHLRAREVLMKINSYAPVTDFEYALRRDVLDEQERATQSAGNTGGANDPWQLNAPLEPSEKDELGLLSDDLQSQSTKLEMELNALGIFVTPVRDPMGRVLLDGAEVSANLVARREGIKRDADKTPP